MTVEPDDRVAGCGRNGLLLLLLLVPEPAAEDTVAEEPVAEEPVAEDPEAEDPVADEVAWFVFTRIRTSPLFTLSLYTGTVRTTFCLPSMGEERKEETSMGEGGRNMGEGGREMNESPVELESDSAWDEKEKNTHACII